MDTISNIWSYVMTFSFDVATIVNHIINTIPTGLVFLLIVGSTVSTFVLSKRCKQLRKVTYQWQMIAKSFEKEKDKLEKRVASLESTKNR